MFTHGRIEVTVSRVTDGANLLTIVLYPRGTSGREDKERSMQGGRSTCRDGDSRAVYYTHGDLVGDEAREVFEVNSLNSVQQDRSLTYYKHNDSVCKGTTMLDSHPNADITR